MSDYRQQIDAVQKALDDLDARMEPLPRSSREYLKLSLQRDDLAEAKRTVERASWDQPRPGTARANLAAE